MADLQKFLNQDGVSILWSRIAQEVASVDNKVAGHETRLATAESKIDALEKGTYDDTAVKASIAENKANIEANDAEILALQTSMQTLNADAETVGSVANTANAAAAAKVAEIVAGADVKYDTLKEIADWILNDTTGAANMANDIAALEAKMAGVDETVVESIASAIEEALMVEGANKYALTSELTTLADRVKAIEDAGYQNAEQVGSAIDAKITALDLDNKYDVKGAASTAEVNAKAHAETKASEAQAAAIAAAATDATTKANTAEANAKKYTDDEMAKIQALSETDILAAIEAAKAQG